MLMAPPSRLPLGFDIFSERRSMPATISEALSQIPCRIWLPAFSPSLARHILRRYITFWYLYNSHARRSAFR